MQNITITRISRRQGIKQLGVSFGSIFLLFFSVKVARGYGTFLVAGEIPSPQLLMAALGKSLKRIQHSKLAKI